MDPNVEVHGHHLQRLAVIPNDTPWYWLAGGILIGAAIVAYGAQLTAERWQKDADLPKWFSVVGGVFGITLATTLGAIVGHLVWHWSIGMICAICGAWGSQWILGLVASRLGGSGHMPNTVGMIVTGGEAVSQEIKKVDRRDPVGHSGNGGTGRPRRKHTRTPS